MSKKAEEKEKEEKDYDFNDDALADLQAKNKRRIILVRHVVFAIVQAYQTSIPTYIACWSFFGLNLVEIPNTSNPPPPPPLSPVAGAH